VPISTWPLWNIYVTNDHWYVPLVVSTSRSFPRSWLITGFVTRLTRQVSIVEQELLTLPEHMSSTPVLNVVHGIRSLALYVCLTDRCLSFCAFFFLAIMLSVLLRYTNSDYSFGIFKLFIQILINFSRTMAHHTVFMRIMIAAYKKYQCQSRTR
jgi:hypothetical protein